MGFWGFGVLGLGSGCLALGFRVCRVELPEALLCEGRDPSSPVAPRGESLTFGGFAKKKLPLTKKDPKKVPPIFGNP